MIETTILGFNITKDLAHKFDDELNETYFHLYTITRGGK